MCVLVVNSYSYVLANIQWRNEMTNQCNSVVLMCNGRTPVVMARHIKWLAIMCLS